jgi:inorganic pyrophosphatase
MRVFIQSEAGSCIKHSHNEKSLDLLGTSPVSRAYPFAYGFVLNTTADDGDNVDCFVLTNTPLRTGDIIMCEPIALMEQIEDDVADHNVLATIPGENIDFDEGSELALTHFVSHVFDHIPGKSIRAGTFLGKEAALRYLADHRDPLQGQSPPTNNQRLVS